MILTFFPKICVKEFEQEGKYWMFQFRLISQCFASMYCTLFYVQYLNFIFDKERFKHIFSLICIEKIVHTLRRELLWLNKLFSLSGKNYSDWTSCKNPQERTIVTEKVWTPSGENYSDWTSCNFSQERTIVNEQVVHSSRREL